jgi:2-amino-4-hydroxy-6-hydroxymethyldihydropteridine diphosphokinase
MTRVFLSFGSNLGDRLQCLREAVERLLEISGVEFVDASPLYWTEPWEARPGQAADESAWFFNCVVSIETSLSPRDLLTETQAIERLLGRRPGPGSHEERRYEPRPVDIDILLYGDRVISAPEQLQIPHLFMHERAFVLRPLADLAPDLVHPVLYQTIEELLTGLEDEHEVRISDLPRRWFER